MQNLKVTMPTQAPCATRARVTVLTDPCGRSAGDAGDDAPTGQAPAAPLANLCVPAGAGDGTVSRRAHAPSRDLAGCAARAPAPVRATVSTPDQANRHFQLRRLEWACKSKRARNLQRPRRLLQGHSPPPPVLPLCFGSTRRATSPVSVWVARERVCLCTDSYVPACRAY